VLHCLDIGLSAHAGVSERVIPLVASDIDRVVRAGRWYIFLASTTGCGYVMDATA
jgi:hypothetical protein